jgi:hypothetical protein
VFTLKELPHTTREVVGNPMENFFGLVAMFAIKPIAHRLGEVVIQLQIVLDNPLLFQNGGDIFINGGNIYAYNHENGHKIPSAAIGGGGSIKAKGYYGNVTITGGNIYAQSTGGTAIG